MSHFHRMFINGGQGGGFETLSEPPLDPPLEYTQQGTKLMIQISKKEPAGE